MFKPGDSGGTGAIPTDLLFKTGMLLPYAGAAAPSGWLLADGSTVSQVTYAALFAVCGTTFNTGGEPVGTFRLPNMISRSVIGAGTTGGLTAVPLGTYKGEENHVLTTAELASHNHGITDPGHNHTQNAHTHVQDAHTHVQDAHTHVQDAHTHVQDPHYHQTTSVVPYTSGSPSIDGTPIGNTQRNAGGAAKLSNDQTATNQNTTATNQNTTATNQNATATNNSNTTGITTNNNGSDSGHNTIHPVLGLTYIIKY